MHGMRSADSEPCLTGHQRLECPARGRQRHRVEQPDLRSRRAHRPVRDPQSTLTAPCRFLLVQLCTCPKERDARVMIGSFANSMALPIFCEVFLIAWLACSDRSHFSFGPTGAPAQSLRARSRKALVRARSACASLKVFGLVSSADQVWMWPGSLFGSERWADALLQQGEAANRTCGRLTRDELLAVVEGSFFLRPHHQPVHIDNGHFRSFQVIRPSQLRHGDFAFAEFNMPSRKLFNQRS